MLEEASRCPICYEPWCATGKHRVVALRCGHLFGRECALDWLESSKESGCPTCASLSEPDEIINVIAPVIFAARKPLPFVLPDPETFKELPIHPLIQTVVDASRELDVARAQRDAAFSLNGTARGEISVSRPFTHSTLLSKGDSFMKTLESSVDFQQKSALYHEAQTKFDEALLALNAAIVTLSEYTGREMRE